MKKLLLLLILYILNLHPSFAEVNTLKSESSKNCGSDIFGKKPITIPSRIKSGQANRNETTQWLCCLKNNLLKQLNKNSAQQCYTYDFYSVKFIKGEIMNISDNKIRPENGILLIKSKDGYKYGGTIPDANISELIVDKITTGVEEYLLYTHIVYEVSPPKTMNYELFYFKDGIAASTGKTVAADNPFIVNYSKYLDYNYYHNIKGFPLEDEEKAIETPKESELLSTFGVDRNFFN